jgi:cytidylate kinase
MKTNIGLHQCVSFINANLGDAPAHSYLGAARPAAWCLTLSRQSGCNAHGIAERTAELFQARAQSATLPWTVFDRNLVEEVLKDHHLPARLREHMPEDRRSELEDIMGELFELHPSAWTMVHQTSDTILRLADRGRCILIGRAANFVTSKLAQTLHVRLIGSLTARLERMQKYDHVSQEEARKLIRDQDRARARYVKKYFEADIEAPEHYHLVLNVDAFDTDQAAQIITHALELRMAAAPKV